VYLSPDQAPLGNHAPAAQIQHSIEGDMTKQRLVLFAVLLLGLVFWLMSPRPGLTPPELAARYMQPLPLPDAPLRVYHLGHSLVGRDMPAMLAQLAGHSYHSQLGWGASLQQHWTGDVPGFATENDTAAFRAAQAAIESGAYDAVILTEMVALPDAIAFHDSADALARWALRARGGNPHVLIYLYETWHATDDPAGWEARIAADGPALWQGRLLAGAMAQRGVGTIYLIPGGPALAAIAARIRAGDLPGFVSRDDLFARGDTGQIDPIHLNDAGNYVIALTHYATLYHRSPVGLPHVLTRADGTAMTPIDPIAARAMQMVVCTALTRYRSTGVAGG
jgi:hypothetical protein